MAVKHLGQFAQPRPSDLSGLSEAIGSGMQAGENRKRTRVLEQEAQTNKKLTDMKFEQMKVDVAKEERAKEEKQRKLATDTIKNVTLRAMGKSDADVKILLESEPMKALAKELVKPVMPESVTADGLLILDRVPYIPKTPEEARKIAEQTKEAMNAIEAKRIPTITQISAMKKNIMSEAYMMGAIDSPEVKEQLDYLSQIQAAAEKVFEDANPNVFTNSLGGGATEDPGDWWNK